MKQTYLIRKKCQVMCCCLPYSRPRTIKSREKFRQNEMIYRHYYFQLLCYKLMQSKPKRKAHGNETCLVQNSLCILTCSSTAIFLESLVEAKCSASMTKINLSVNLRSRIWLALSQLKVMGWWWEGELAGEKLCNKRFCRVMRKLFRSVPRAIF